MLIKKIMSYNNYEKDENTWYDKMTIAILNEQALCLDWTVDPWTIYSCDDPKFKARRGRRDGPVISNRVDYGRRSCSSQFQRDKHRLSQTVSNLGTVGRKINSVSLQATALRCILLRFFTSWELSYHALPVLMAFAVTLPLSSSPINPRIFMMYLQIIQQNNVLW